MNKFKKLILTTMISSIVATSAWAGELVINSDASDPAPKAAFAEIIKKFEKAYPDIHVKYNLYDHESYKTTIRNWLATSPPDVVFWYAGNRMKAFVKRGMFEDVSDIWKKNNMYTDFAAAKEAMTVDGKQYGVPYTYYQWGIYYRKDLFDKYGIAEPKTWDQLVEAAKVLKANGIAPFTIGTKYLWTAAGWFDYIDLRVNGLKFHIDLMEGRIPWTDPRVRAVFAKWDELIKPGYYLENHASYSWQEAQPFMFNGKAAMYLIGNFFAANFTPEQRKQIDFFQFPEINPNVPMAEDAPMDTLHIPTKAKNKKDARIFLEFMAKPENAELINNALLQIPTNNKAKVKDDKYLNKGVKMLNSASGTAQFFDRDADPQMAKEAMKGLQEFMVHPDRLDQILNRLEKIRERVYKVKN